MAEKLVDLKLWPNVPDNINSDYFDMQFAETAEKTMRITDKQ